MKFGKRLAANLYEPWAAEYMRYSRYKRLLKRLRFLRESHADQLGVPLRRRTESGGLEMPPEDDDPGEYDYILKPSVSTREMSQPQQVQQQQQQQQGQRLADQKKKNKKMKQEKKKEKGKKRGGDDSDDEDDGRKETVNEQATCLSCLFMLWIWLCACFDGFCCCWQGYDKIPSTETRAAAGSVQDAEAGGTSGVVYSGSSGRSTGGDNGGADGCGKQSNGGAEHKADAIEGRASEDDEDRVAAQDAQMARLAEQRIQAQFFEDLDADMKRVSEFFGIKLSELSQKVRDFCMADESKYRSTHGHTFKELRVIFAELVALCGYQDLNRNGFRKIVKKFDKNMDTSFLHETESKLAAAPWTSDETPRNLLEQIRSLVNPGVLYELEKHVYASESDLLMFPKVKALHLGVSFAIFLVALLFSTHYQTTKDGCLERCFALLLFVTALWVSEALPFFATALLVPPLGVFLRVMRDNTTGEPMDAEGASKALMGAMITPTWFLILGGFALSGAVSHCAFERHLAAALQRALGTRPLLFMFVMMLFSLFLSMWISNHTAPVLASTILAPILGDMEVTSPFAKAMLLGVAFACNFGGMTTQVSSMQNAMAASALYDAGVPVSFGSWLCISIPFCLTGVAITFGILLLIFRPFDVKRIPLVVYELRADLWTPRNIAVFAACIATIGLWSCFALVRDIFGDLAIVSLLFCGLVFGSGVLTELDFNSMRWHALFLLAGGNALGLAVKSSRLLDTIADMVLATLPLENTWLCVIEIIIFCTIVATFTSHTVAAVVLMPLLVSVGKAIGHVEVVVLGSAFAISAAMALPFSSFPNNALFLVVDEVRQNYVTLTDFIKAGIPTSLMAVALLATLGFVLIEAIAAQ